MKKQVLLSGILFVLAAFSSSCGSSGYDLDEENVEAPKTETKTEIKEDIEQPKTEIKQEINKDIGRNYVMPSVKTYSVQIGAFSMESNARDFVSHAESLSNYDVDCKEIDGLYKVRIGNFKNISDALTLLGDLRNKGFSDAFMTESK